MFNSNTDNLYCDLLVLFMDKVLYDNGFPITENKIDYDQEFTAYEEAMDILGGVPDYNDNNDYAIVFRNDCLKKYIGLALKYGSMNGIPKDNNFWIKRLEAYIANSMHPITDENFSYDYYLSSTRKFYLQVYITNGFTETAGMIQAIASILHFAGDSCKELERLTEKRKAKIIPMKKQKERKMAA
mgnify:FL=1